MHWLRGWGPVIHNGVGDGVELEGLSRGVAPERGRHLSDCFKGCVLLVNAQPVQMPFHANRSYEEPPKKGKGVASTNSCAYCMPICTIVPASCFLAQGDACLWMILDRTQSGSPFKGSVLLKAFL